MDFCPPTLWCDCKVAYSIADEAKFERWAERTNWCEGLLPQGWQLVETDTSGARMVAIFRVEVMPTVEAGNAVYQLLAKHGGYRASRRKKLSTRPVDLRTEPRVAVPVLGRRR